MPSWPGPPLVALVAPMWLGGCPRRPTSRVRGPGRWSSSSNRSRPHWLLTTARPTRTPLLPWTAEPCATCASFPGWGEPRPARAASEPAQGGDGDGVAVSSGHLRDVQMRVGEVELVHFDDLPACIAHDPAAYAVGRRAAGFHRGTGLPGRGGAAQSVRPVHQQAGAAESRVP